MISDSFEMRPQHSVQQVWDSPSFCFWLELCCVMHESLSSGWSWGGNNVL